MKKLSIIILLIVGAFFSLWGGLNYSGFCVEEGRWLTGNEVYGLIIKYYNRLNKRNYMLEPAINLDSSLRENNYLEKNEDFILHISRDAAYTNNGYMSASNSYIIFGDAAYVFNIKPLNKESEVKRPKLRNLTAVVSNCGDIHTDDWYY